MRGLEPEWDGCSLHAHRRSYRLIIIFLLAGLSSYSTLNICVLCLSEGYSALWCFDLVVSVCGNHSVRLPLWLY
jgi:hypothetical protein